MLTIFQLPTSDTNIPIWFQEVSDGFLNMHLEHLKTSQSSYLTSVLFLDVNFYKLTSFETENSQ